VQATARLVETSVPPRPRAVVLVLHGGASRRGAVRVSPTQLSVLRMLPIAARVAHAARRELAVLRLLNSVRGWDATHTPVRDVKWALSEVRARFGPELPVALVGHSLGGRAALWAATDDQVRSVVGLATWVHAGEGLPPLPGRQVLLVHGDEDRIARRDNAAAAAARLRRSAGVAGFVTVHGGRHSMLRRQGTFDGLAAEWVAATLLGRPVRAPLAGVLAGTVQTASV
jgi:pimeloyl-ACP methyl ester carboxylesterase